MHAAGYQDKYDFLYMPMNLPAKTNPGYAFINFRSVEWAAAFILQFNKGQLPRYDSKKQLECSPAKIQGYQPNVESLMKSVTTHSLPVIYKPLRLLRGELVSFP